MSMLMYETIVLLSIGTIWVMSSYLYSRSKKKSDPYLEFLLNAKTTGYAITLIFSIVGIVLALWLTHEEAVKADRANAEKMLHALSTNCLAVERSIGNFYVTITQQLVESGKDSGYIIEAYNDVPLIPILGFESALNSELVITNIHPYIYEALADCYRNSFVSIERLKKVSNTEELLIELKSISNYMKLSQNIITIEANNRKASDVLIKEMIEESYRAYFGAIHRFD
ncbi:MAG: hypothetical protein FWG30_11130 [Eubacteriaceae bacterium]|nr:hypothetical protein [Eubacteriaceae bacterium]